MKLQEIHAYLEIHKALRMFVVSVGFGIASLCLFMGAVYNLVVAGGRPYDLFDVLLPLTFFLVAFLSALGTAWTLHSAHARGIWSTLMLVLGSVVIGAILVSFAVWRQHWFELVREIFG